MRIIRIGKSPSNDIYQEFKGDPTVSREHCEIFVDDENNVFLTDLNSTNGTYVNGTRVISPVMLKKLDIVRAGNSLVKWKEYISGGEVEFVETIENKEESQKINNRLRNNTTGSDKLYTVIKIIFGIIILLLLIKFCDSNTESISDNDKLDSFNEEERKKETLEEKKSQYDFEADKDVIKYCPTPKNGHSPYNSIFGTGVYSNYVNNSFLIKNTQSSHAVVLLVNSNTGKKIRNEFIRKGSQFEMTKVPNGTYHLRWVSGNDWCPDLKFGNLTGGFQNDMSFSETSDPSDRMRVSGGNGWEVTLYAVVGGDVNIEGINQYEFIN